MLETSMKELLEQHMLL